MAKAKFRYNTRELATAVQRELMLFPDRARRAMNAVGGYLAGEAKERSPVDEGFLTADIANRTIENKGSFSAAIYIPSNATSSDYAIPMHEGQEICVEIFKTWEMLICSRKRCAAFIDKQKIHTMPGLLFTDGANWRKRPEFRS